MSNADHWLNYLVCEDVVLARSRVHGHWGIELEHTAGAYFHFVGEGRAYVQIEGSPQITLGPGDIVVFPQGSSHRLRGTVTSKTVPLSQFIRDAEVRSSPAVDATTLLCGSFGIARYMIMPAVKSLPRLMHLKAPADGSNAPFAQTLQQLCDEVESAGMGSEIVVRHLLSTLFVYVLRQWSELHPTLAQNWFSSLQNQHVAKALECIHKDPAENWTIDTLAHEAGLSRSLFARQFHESVAETPHLYLTRWRLGIAAQLLGQTDLSVSELAKKIGYRSVYSFVRAFKQAQGLTPTQHRASRRAARAASGTTCGLATAE
jgi:AraC-like DNA-binding protein